MRRLLPKLRDAQGLIGVLSLASGVGLVLGAVGGVVLGAGAGLVVLGGFLLVATASGA